MHKADIDSLSKKFDEIKQISGQTVHNIFMDINSIREVIQNNNCLLANYDKSLFFLIPRHNQFYEVLFCSASEEWLLKDIASFISEYNGDLDLRVSVIGHDDKASRIAGLFGENNFVLGRKIARMRNGLQSGELNTLIAEFVKEKKYNVEFARPGDESEIFSLLKSEFDLRADNIPELGEIVENIKLNQVLVVRSEGKIIAMHYYTSKNSTEYGWYDITDKKYRKENIYFYIMDFQIKLLEKRKLPVRQFSWRDVANKRLMELARKCNQQPDGVFIYNMLYNVSDKVNQA